MTLPAVRATGSLRSVLFDGTTVTLANRTGSKVLAHVPLGELVSITLAPQRTGGYLELHTTTNLGARARTYYGRQDAPAFEAVAAAITAALAARPAPSLLSAPADPWGSTTAAAAPTRPTTYREPAAMRWLLRLSIVELVLVSVPALVFCGLLLWLVFAVVFAGD